MPFLSLVLVPFFLVICVARAEDPPSLGQKRYQTGGTGDTEMNKLYPRLGGPDSDDKNAIHGRCVVKSDLPEAVQIPCPSTFNVLLLDGQDRILDGAALIEGEFRFKIGDDRTYYVTIDSEKFRMDPKKVGPLKKGDSTIVKVRKISK